MNSRVDPTSTVSGDPVDLQDVSSEVLSDISSAATDNVPLEVKQVTQELLRHGYIEESADPALFRKAVVHDPAIQVALLPLDLTLRLDTHRGIAFLVVSKAANNVPDGDEAWSHPLVRRQRFTMEQSLIVAILRQAFMFHEQEAGIGHSMAKVAVEDLLAQFLTYFDDSGSDARNKSRLMTLLDQLKVHGIVSEVDNNQEITIRPMIAHLANAESLAALLRALKDKAASRESPEAEHE